MRQDQDGIITIPLQLRAETVEREKQEALRRAEAVEQERTREKLELTRRIRELEEQISRST
ncbi:hypothetical protein LQZ19_18175 [Treponema primitia]|uniref:hypothetical protein n=1 Tax=Treponema primitia TaxID=88058 RepID=UPI00397F8373